MAMLIAIDALDAAGKENQSKHRQVLADFLPRIPNLKGASKAKPIPSPMTRLPQKIQKYATT